MDDRQRYELHAAVFGALAHPVRHELFHRLCEADRSLGELAHELGISKTNISQHLAVLRREGLARRLGRGRSVRWQVVDTRLAQACTLIDEVLGRELQVRLQALADDTLNNPTTEQKESPHVREERKSA